MAPLRTMLGLLLALASLLRAYGQGPDPLPSWNDGDAKRAIVDFVSCAGVGGCSGCIPPDDGIAAFDNDCTL